MFKTSKENLKWWVLIATSSSLAMIFLDQSALPIAMPSIQRAWHLSSELLQWVINAYLLTLAVLIILGGKLGDKFGHRSIFLWGMIVFIAASILCAASPNLSTLLVGRVLQGIGGALMMPSAGPLFRTIVSPEEFGKMIGLYVAIASIFLIIGPTLGGFFTAYLSWRWIFWINFPVAILAITIVIAIIPVDSQDKKSTPRFDWIGFFSLSFSLISFVFALMQAQALGWLSPIILGCLITALISFMVFLRTEKNHPFPFVDLNLFKNLVISKCIMTMALVQIAYIGIIFWALFLQYTLSLSAQKTGIFLLAVQAPVLFSSGFAGKLLEKKGPRFSITMGTLALTISCLWIAIFAWKNSFAWLCPAFILFGASSPFVTIGIMSSVISAATPEKRGVVSGIISAARQIGGSIGLAVLVALETNVSSYLLNHWLQKVTGNLKQLRPEHLHALLLGNPLPAHLHLTNTELAQAHHAVIHAYTVGFSCIMMLITIFIFIGYYIARRLPNQLLTY